MAIEDHTVRRLVPDIHKLPKCEATVTLETQQGATDIYRQNRKRYADKHGTRYDQCKHGAKWVIDGKHLCTRHAGMAALTILSENREYRAPANEMTWKGTPFSQLTQEQRDEMKRSLWK